MAGGKIYIEPILADLVDKIDDIVDEIDDIVEIIDTKVDEQIEKLESIIRTVGATASDITISYQNPDKSKEFDVPFTATHSHNASGSSSYNLKTFTVKANADGTLNIKVPVKLKVTKSGNVYNYGSGSLAISVSAGSPTYITQSISGSVDTTTTVVEKSGVLECWITATKGQSYTVTISHTVAASCTCKSDNDEENLSSVTYSVVDLINGGAVEVTVN